MWYDKVMDYLQARRRHYHKGLKDGLMDKVWPGPASGVFRECYFLGNKRGKAMKDLTDFKTK